MKINTYLSKPALKEIMKRIQDANVGIIKCGWLKNSFHKECTSFYHVPSDIEQYLLHKNKHFVYVVMINLDGVI